MFTAPNTIKPFEKKVWLSTPTRHPEMMEYIQNAYDTNWLSTIGENINEVERQMAERIGCRYAVGLGTGTAALHLAVKLAGVKRGDRVFCSDMTFSATVNPVSYEGAEQIYIDSEYEGQRSQQDTGDAGLADEVEEVRRHHEMLKRLIGE